MEADGRNKLREYVRGLLLDKDDTAPFTDSEPLFTSGRLDSLAAVEIVTFLEEQFAMDFSDINFDTELLDSIDLIASLVDANT